MDDNFHITDTVNYPLPLENIIDSLEEIGYIINTYRVHYPDQVLTYKGADLHILNPDLLSVVMEKHIITLTESGVVDIDVWIGSL